MKWIGQNIYDKISRFRDDIYLEDISTGTIASGGNLGLDSNNKIVKAAEVGSSVDLTSEVTGVLPSANLDADTAHLSGTQTFTGTKTLNSFKGTSGATVTNINDTDTFSDASATTLATSESIKAYADTKVSSASSIEYVYANFRDNAGTNEHFIPLAGVPDEKTGFSNEQVLLLVPTGGYVKEIIVRALYDTYTSENIVLKVYTRAKNKKINNKTQIGSDITIAAPLQATTDDDNTRSTGDLGTSYPYVKYDMLGISMTWQSTGPTDANDRTFVTVVLANNLTDLGY